MGPHEILGHHLLVAEQGRRIVYRLPIDGDEPFGEPGHIQSINGEKMKVAFIGLGNVGSKLAGSVLRNGHALMVCDVDPAAVAPFVDAGAGSHESPAELARFADVVVTCLPEPRISAEVLEREDGVLAGLSPGKIWAEMSTTDASEVLRLGKRVEALGAHALDCPVSGGCHRAATGNIAIFAGGRREAFERALPLLSSMGRRILHTGELGSASRLKVMTNYLATANLVSLTEALVTASKAGMDLPTAYEAIRISSGNSFVHETESQVILNGSRNIDFTMGLVRKDIGLFQDLAEQHGVELELSPLLIKIFEDGIARYGANENSPNIIKRLEEQANTLAVAPGFPAEMVDDEPEEPGGEVTPAR
ncbi:MAG: 3-hydroxyisobutyrate dehydrogenase [Myxococcota bacterium]